MNYQKAKLILSLTAALSLPAAAAGAPRSHKSVPCPAVIADKASAKYESAKRRNGRYQCFAKTGDARKAGFISGRSLDKIDYGGWYRLKFNRTADSCGGPSGPDGPVLFLQIMQQGAGLYGDFCPSTGRFYGARVGDGISASRTAAVNELTNPLGCRGGLVEVSEHLELSRAAYGASGFTATLRVNKRCPSEDEGLISCEIEMSGIAFKETHALWPEPASNPSIMKASCGTALKSCAGCHEAGTGGGINP